MGYSAPSMNDMFAGVPVSERAERFEAYKATLADIHSKTLNKAARGEIAFAAQTGVIEKASTVDRVAELREEFANKSINPDDVATINGALDQLTESIQKDWTLTNPLNSTPYGNLGLIPYDLSPALAMLVPKFFGLRQSITRTSGVGEATEYRRILGVSNSASGSVANLSTFFQSSSAQATFGSSLALNRPPKISYAADRQVRAYVEEGLSDSVAMQAQFAGQGFADLRSLSHTATMWATWLGEERNFLNARSSGTGYLGALVTSGVTASAGAAAGGTLATGTTYANVTFLSSYGETAAISASSVTTSSLNASVTVVVSGGIPSGAISANIYIVQGSSYWVTNTTKLTSLTTSGTGVTISAPGTVTTNAGPVANGTATALGYDGLVAVACDTATSGYVKQLNGATLSTSTPGTEFQAGFSSLYASVLGDPEEILTTGSIRAELTAALETQGSNGAYRINYMAGPEGATVGKVVTAIQNATTGTVCDINVHPYMPAGVAIFRQRQLPFPDSGVSDTVEARNVQDWLVLEWPVIQTTYDLSTYKYGTLLHKAPAWQGAIVGIG